MSQIEKIEKAIVELAKRESAYESALMEAAEAEHNYRLRKNTEIKQAEGSEKVKIATAEFLCESEMKRKLTAEAVKEILKTKVEDARTVISARKEIMIIEARFTGQK